jgi:hypothetical protein
MELKDFVKDTLIQIMEGVKEAQVECKELGGLVNPMLEPPISNAARYKVNDKYYPACKVSFKVGLSELDATGGKNGIGVFLSKISMGAERTKGSESQSVTNIEFDVTVVFPYITREGKHVPLDGFR